MKSVAKCKKKKKPPKRKRERKKKQRKIKSGIDPNQDPNSIDEGGCRAATCGNVYFFFFFGKK